VADARIKFSSLEDAVKKINDGRANMEAALDGIKSAVVELIDNKVIEGEAAATFENRFEELKNRRFDKYIALVQDFANIIEGSRRSTQETADSINQDADKFLAV
jgi:uncharacterized protein YukE